MKLTLLTTTFLFVNYFITGQTLGGTDQNIAPIYNNLSVIENNKKFTTSFFKDVEGTPYIFKDFVQGEIVGIPSQFRMRYNAYDDVVEIEKKPGEVYTVSKDPQYHTFLLLLKQYKLRLVTLESEKKEPLLSYLFEINKTNKINLLRQDKINFKEGRVPRNSFDLGAKPKFSAVTSSYYLEVMDQKIIEFPTSKSKLLALYPSKEKELKKFLKNTPINFKNESDLKALSQFLSTL